jgi:hypothetical protein
MQTANERLTSHELISCGNMTTNIWYVLVLVFSINNQRYGTGSILSSRKPLRWFESTLAYVKHKSIFSKIVRHLSQLITWRLRPHPSNILLYSGPRFAALLQFTPRAPKWTLSFRFLLLHFVRISLHTHLQTSLGRLRFICISHIA